MICNKCSSTLESNGEGLPDPLQGKCDATVNGNGLVLGVFLQSVPFIGEKAGWRVQQVVRTSALLLHVL